MRKPKLNRDMMLKTTVLLAKGMTDKDTCKLVGIHVSTFYRWLEWGRALADDKEAVNLPDTLTSDGEPFKTVLQEFCEAVTHARAKAVELAVDAIQSAIEGQAYTTEKVETFSETRLDKSGKPYTYTKEIKTITYHEVAPDYRAAIEFLKRRYTDEWGNTVKEPSIGQQNNLFVVTGEQLQQAKKDAKPILEDFANERLLLGDGTEDSTQH